MASPEQPAPPAAIADLISELNHARAEAQDGRIRVEMLERQYHELESICGTQADDLARLRKVEAAHAAAKEERAKMTERLGRLQALVNDYKSASGTLRLVLWQARRLLFRGK
ncbi:MAG: hypothetical protein PHC88_03010 [Terrimicrobiaceae bacterium]|nr:hypothetical protein [Terrimicrobiaceae bacterium]